MLADITTHFVKVPAVIENESGEEAMEFSSELPVWPQGAGCVLNDPNDPIHSKVQRIAHLAENALETRESAFRTRRECDRC